MTTGKGPARLRLGEDMYTRSLLFATAAMCCGLGCTHTALERRTVKQASTLTDLQYQQVLDNLAMLACTPDTMPWHLKLNGGLVQIADQGNAGFEANLASGISDGVKNIFSPSAGAQRGVVGQWDLDPAVEADELALLAIAYRKATCPGDPELQGKIDKAICDLCVKYDIIPDEDVLKRIFANNDVQLKIAQAKGDICEQLGGVKTDDLKKLLPEDCKAKVDDTFLGLYSTSLQQTLSLRLLDLTQTQKAVEKIVNSPAEQPAGRQAYGAMRLHAATDARSAAYRSGPSTFSPMIERDDKKKVELPKPLSASEQILFALHLACDPGYVPPAWTHEPSGRNVGLVAQAGDKIEKLQDLVKEPKFQQPWLNVGCKRDVPKCACYVGHYKACGRECYVWVMPEQVGMLREFTQVVLTLAPNEKQDLGSMIPGRGAAFSPSLGR